jgi:hypothetical protein
MTRSLSLLGAALACGLLSFTVPGLGQALPAGATPCEMAGYSIDADPRGANIRAEPNAKAKVLGRLAPPQKASQRDDAFPNDGVWRTAFQIIGFKDGWFLIEKAQHPFDDPETIRMVGRRSTGGVRTYTGRGWIAGSLVGGQYSNRGGLPAGALYSEPRADASRTPAKNALGAEVGADGGPKRVLACDGDWVKVESHDGVTGWWNSLCSQQVTNCS